MSTKEIAELLKDLIESNKQLALRLKMIEIELNYIKENLPGRITNIIEKIDNKISQKYIKDLLSKKMASGNTYQKGSMDETLIHEFLKKQKLKEKDLYNLEENSDKSENIKESEKDE